MRKSNWIIIAIIVVASIIFLGMWYYFGFNYVDDPLDLVISIIWWVLIVAICIIINKVEKDRQRAIRTVYLAPNFIFNTELGVINLGPDGKYVPVIQRVLSNLEYDFDKQDTPEENKSRSRFRYIVHTNKFEDNGDTWEGEIIMVSQPDRPFEFNGRHELAAVLDNR